MSSKKSVWYRLGYAYEQAKQAPARSSRKLASLKERATPSAPKKDALPDLDELMASGAAALAAKALDRWRPRRSTGLVSLLRAGASGAAAALLVDLVRPLLSGQARVGDVDEETLDHLLSGAVQGLVYASVADRWIPGPPLLKGSVFGTAEYVTHAMGGVSGVLGNATVLHRLPMVGSLLKELAPEDRDYLEQVVFGVALALLYGSDSSSGIVDDSE
ncbi:MAG: hypothetical protein RJQ04_04570 [Longimicrobiales bacterium]